MTDKALEAALLPCPFCGAQGDVWRSTGTDWYGNWFCGCSNQNCIAVGRPYGSGPAGQAHAIAAWNRRAPLSALPGEAEVVMEHIAHKEQIGIWANEITSALSLSDFLREDWSFDDSVDLEKEVAAQLLDIIRSAITHPGLNLVASLQAMQARAEKAERERDALREALKPSGETKAEYIGEFAIAVERYVNSDEEVDDEGESAMDPYEHVTVPWTTIKEIMAAISERAARTALKGDSNG